MSDPNIEIDLEELLRGVTPPQNTDVAPLLDSLPTDITQSQSSLEVASQVSFDVPSPNVPDLDDILMLSKHRETIGEKARDPSEVDLTLKEFPEVKKFFKDSPHHLFDTTDFYKKVLQNDSDDKTRRLHLTLTKYLTCKDPKDKTIFRQDLTQSYWNFISTLPTRIVAGISSKEEKYALRFGLLLPTLLTEEQKAIFAKVVDENPYCEAVYYLDEWFSAIGKGLFPPSSTDEVLVNHSNEAARVSQLLEKTSGKMQSSQNLLRAKSDERTRVEEAIKQKINGLFAHSPVSGMPEVLEPYDAMQKQAISSLPDMAKSLLKLDKELNDFLNAYRNAEGDTQTLKARVQATEASANVGAAEGEYDTIRQMAKMSCGRKGNHFPILSREFFRTSTRDIGTRENVLRELRWIESIDSQAYCRQCKTQLNRIPPFVILVPSYGDIGFCWEPFDRYNRVTSRGRIVIPMYSRSLRLVLLMATADLRWQVAKEKASYYWMEEGLTGNYYQWFQTQDIKMDIKDSFVQDYILWMTKECDGVQKLDKEVRDIFWRYMPFTDAIKEKLKTRSWVYQELCQKDLNRQMSDGY